MKLCTDINGWWLLLSLVNLDGLPWNFLHISEVPQRYILMTLGGPLTFYLVSPTDQSAHLSCEISQHLLNGLAQNFCTDVDGSQRMNELFDELPDAHCRDIHGGLIFFFLKSSSCGLHNYNKIPGLVCGFQYSGVKLSADHWKRSNMRQLSTVLLLCY